MGLYDIPRKPVEQTVISNLPSLTVADAITLNNLGFELTGSGIVWDDVGPTSITVGNTGANNPAYTTYNSAFRAYEFVGTGATIKEMSMGFQLPHRAIVNSPIKPHLHLYIPNDVNGGTIKFTFDYLWANVGTTGAMNGLSVTGTVVRPPNAGVANNEILSFGLITPWNGDVGGLSSVIMARVYRNPVDPADTFESSVWLKSADIHYQSNTLGTVLEFTK